MHMHVCGISAVTVEEVRAEGVKTFFVLTFKSTNHSEVEIMFQDTEALFKVAEGISQALLDRAAGKSIMRVQEW